MPKFVREAITETVLREEAIAWVEERAAANGGWVTHAEASSEFIPSSYGRPFRLVDAHGAGIWNPHQLAATLSITTKASGPYVDVHGDDGLLRYSYEKASAGRNTKLRRAMDLGVPILVFINDVPGALVPVAPAYVIEDDREARRFTVALSEDLLPVEGQVVGTGERRYAEYLAEKRLHQPVFRARVLKAYGSQCSVCQLRHPKLLQAAHIYPDRHPQGSSSVVNGLSLCGVHHAAYDADLLGITPDHVVQLDDDLLAEVDGPMLRHGLQEMHGRVLTLPARRQERPDRNALAYRYEAFRR